MNTRSKRIFATGMLSLITLVGGGCSMADQARDIPGDDLTILERGVDRATIHAALGPPIRSWRPNDTVDYELHAVRRPLKGSASEAGAVLFLDVITLGVWEAAAALDPEPLTRKSVQEYRLIWIGFDGNGHVCGTYSEFAVLPETPAGADLVIDESQRGP